MKKLMVILASMTLAASPVVAVACSTTTKQDNNSKTYSTVRQFLDSIKGEGLISEDGNSIQLSTIQFRNIKNTNSVNDTSITELGQQIAKAINKKVPSQSFSYGTDFVMQYKKSSQNLEIRLPQGSSSYSLGDSNGVIVLNMTSTPTDINDILTIQDGSLVVDSSNSSLDGISNSIENSYGLVKDTDFTINLNEDNTYTVSGISNNGFTGSTTFSTTVTYDGDKEMYLSSSQVKAAIVGANDSSGVSTNYLVNKLANQTLTDSFGESVANNTNIFDSSNSNTSELYSDSIYNSVIDSSTNKISSSIKTNIVDASSSKDQTPGDQLKSLLGIFEYGVDAIGGSDGSNFEKASEFIDKYSSIINTVSDSFTWDGLNNFASSVGATINDDSSFDDVFKIENQYLAAAINKAINNTTADKDATISDTISFLLNSKLNNSSVELFSGEEWISVIPAALTYLRTLNDFIGLFNVDDMTTAITTQDVTHIFSSTATNIEYKKEMLDTKFLSNEDVKNNSYKLTNLAMMLDKIGNPSSTDTKGIGLQQFMYILMGDSIENESITNSNNLVYQILSGVKGFAVKYISSAAGNISEDLISALLGGLDDIFNSVPKVLSNNDNFDLLFTSISNLYSSVKSVLFSPLDIFNLVWNALKSKILDAINKNADDDHKISEDDLKSLLKDELPNILSSTTQDPFKSEYSNILGKIQNSSNDGNILNNIFNSISDLITNQSTGIGLVNKVVSAITNSDFDLSGLIDGLKEKLSPLLTSSFGLYDLDNQKISDIVKTFAGEETANKIPTTIGDLKISDITQKLLEISNEYNIDINASTVVEPIGKLFKGLSQSVQIVTNQSVIKDEPESTNIFDILYQLKTGDIAESSIKQIIFGTGDNAVTVNISGQQTVSDALMGYVVTTTGYTIIDGSILDVMGSLSTVGEKVADIVLDLAKEFLANWDTTKKYSSIINVVIDLVKNNLVPQIEKIKDMIDFGKDSTDNEYDTKHNVSDLMNSINDSSQWTYSMVSQSNSKIVYNLKWNKLSSSYQVVLKKTKNDKWMITDINKK